MKHIEGRIELPEPLNKDKEEIRKLREAIRLARYIKAKYSKTLPAEAWDCIGKILNDPQITMKGGKKKHARSHKRYKDRH